MKKAASLNIDKKSVPYNLTHIKALFMLTLLTCSYFRWFMCTQENVYFINMKEYFLILGSFVKSEIISITRYIDNVVNAATSSAKLIQIYITRNSHVNVVLVLFSFVKFQSV